MKFSTHISKTQDGQHFIRGKKVTDLINEHTFAEVMFLLLRGDMPTKEEAALLDSMMVAAVENGIEAPSAYVPRVVASTGNAFNVAMAAGVLTISEKHGGAVEEAARLIGSADEAQTIVEQNKIIPGFGHKLYKDEDPRATVLNEKARALGFNATFFDKAYAIEKALEVKTGKHLPLNIDGAMAACMLELGFDWRLGKAFFIIARTVGMAAHVLEEIEQGGSYHRLDEGDVTYE